MIYTGNKIRVSARIPWRTIQFIRDNKFVLNRFVNAALERLFYEIDHNLLLSYTIDQLKNDKMKNTTMTETQPVQLRIERMFYERMMMDGYVRNRTIVAAIDNYIAQFRQNKIAKWKLNEIRKAL